MLTTKILLSFLIVMLVFGGVYYGVRYHLNVMFWVFFIGFCISWAVAATLLVYKVFFAKKNDEDEGQQVFSEWNED